MAKRSEAKGKINGSKRKVGPLGEYDGRLAAKAIQKYCRGEEPTAREAAALQRVEGRREEDLRWDYYRTIPLKHWVQMSGRQRRNIRDQAERYGLPFGGAVIDLAAFVRAFHDFLAKNWRKLSDESEEEMLFSGDSSPALERYRLARAMREESKLLEDQGQLIQKEKIHECFSFVATSLRTAGDLLQRKFGSEAHEIIVDALGSAEKEIEKSFGNHNGI